MLGENERRRWINRELRLVSRNSCQGCDRRKHDQSDRQRSRRESPWGYGAGSKDPGLQAAPTMYALHCEHVQRVILQCGALFIGDPSTQEAFTH
ncbi:unnamed protein product [Boreogadus saida]